MRPKNCLRARYAVMTSGRMRAKKQPQPAIRIRVFHRRDETNYRRWSNIGPVQYSLRATVGASQSECPNTKPKTKIR